MYPMLTAMMNIMAIAIVPMDNSKTSKMSFIQSHPLHPQ
jgi:hypothetical protein